MKFEFVDLSRTLRALYLGDNDFETIPPEIGQLVNLQIVRIFFLKLLIL